jgi:hypothetical protein
MPTRDELREAMRRGRRRVPLAPVEAPLPTEREDAMLDELQALLDVRAQHHADMERIDAGDLAGTDTVTVFATLRDIADAEPLFDLIDAAGTGETVGVACLYCRAEALLDASLEQLEHRVEHLISCPWARTVQIVGVKTDQPAPQVLAVCRCGHYERDHETRGWRACSRRDACGCQLYTERGSDGG